MPSGLEQRQIGFNGDLVPGASDGRGIKPVKVVLASGLDSIYAFCLG